LSCDYKKAFTKNQWAKNIGSVMLVRNVRVTPPNRLSRKGEWL
jgi:hypothetical protein